jgi:GLPGLI family protein
MKQLLFIISFSLTSLFSFAQARFIDEGRIIYERKIAQVTLLESTQKPGEENAWVAEFKKIAGRVVTDSFSLDFNSRGSYYTAIKESQETPFLFPLLKADPSNFVYQDLTTGIINARQQVFETSFFIVDSASKYNWKIGNEVRDIAGFECRKATTKICDSVVVVAFYTEQIMPGIGPHNFSGLPGTILGIAVPRLSLTLFATRVELSGKNPSALIKQDKKLKPTTREKMGKDILEGVKDWGDNYQISLWGIAL